MIVDRRDIPPTWLAVASLVVFIALAVVAWQHQRFALDVAVAAFVQGQRQPLLDGPMSMLSFVGSGWVLVPVAAVLAMIAWRRPRRPTGSVVAVMVVGTAVLPSIIKVLVGRTRPRGHAYGFPSGHVLGSVVCFGALVYLLWTSDVSRFVRWVGTVLCVLVVAGVAYSRIYLNAHWLTDVLGGATAGTSFLVWMLRWGERSAVSGEVV